MSPRTVGWFVAAVVGMLAIILIGDVVFLGLLPFVVVAVVVTFLFAANRQTAGTAAHVRSQIRRQLLMGSPATAAEQLTPMLAARSSSRRRFAAEMLVVAVQAGVDDARVLDALPRLVGLAPTFRIGRALVAHGRLGEAIEVLAEAADGHDPVAWAEYVGALTAAGRLDEVHGVVKGVTARPSIEAVLHTVRRLDDTVAIESVRDAFAVRLGNDDPAVLLLDVKLGRGDEALPAFVAAHQTTTDGDRAAWVAWAGAASGSPVALEHLDRIIGQMASAPTAVAVMLASVHLGYPEIALRLAPGALSRARADVRSALHLTFAHALAAVGRIDESIAGLYSVSADVALVAALTPPLSPAIRDSVAYGPLVDHIVKE